MSIIDEHIKETEEMPTTGSNQITKNMNLTTYNRELTETKKKLEEARKEDNSFGDSIEALKDKLKDNSKALNEANAVKKSPIIKIK